LKSGNRKV